MDSPLFHHIVVVELPPLKPAGPSTAAPVPKFVLVLPHGDPSRVPRNVLTFCFPDLDHLLRAPFAYEHTADEYVFTLTAKENPLRLHGFCRRYRIGGPGVAHRLDLPPHTSADELEAAAVPTYQCICILSEKCVRGLGGRAPEG